eukprot:3951540-Alexandrium_andersonii.AAC.1
MNERTANAQCHDAQVCDDITEHCSLRVRVPPPHTRRQCPNAAHCLCQCPLPPTRNAHNARC